MLVENVANFAQTTLAAPLGGGTGSTSLSVASTAGFPAVPFRVRIGSEILLVTATAGTTWTVSRAQESTSDAAYPAGELVTQVLTAAGIKGIFVALTGLTPPGRLSANTDAVPAADVTGATTLRYLPYCGRQVWLFTNGEWVAHDIGSSGVSLALGTLVSQVNYDVFLYSNSGTPTLELGVWKNATVTISIAPPGVVTWNSHGMSELAPVVFTTTGALPTGLAANTKYFVRNVTTNTFQLSSTPTGSVINTSGIQSGTHTGYASHARTADLDAQDGWLVKGGDATRLYLGTIRTSSTTTIEDSVAKRFVANMYHRVARKLYAAQSASHTYTGSAWRTWNNANSGYPIVEFVVPGSVRGDAVIATINAQFSVTNSGGGHTGVAYDGNNWPAFEGTTMVTVSNRTNAPRILDIATPGYHTILACEYPGGSATTFDTATLAASVNL